MMAGSVTVFGYRSNTGEGCHCCWVSK